MMTALSESIWLTLNNHLIYNSIRMYRHACFDFLKKVLATTNSSSVSTSFSSCIVLRSVLSFGYQTKMALTCLLKSFGMGEYVCFSNHKQQLRCLPEMDNSNRGCLLLLRSLLAMISSMINSVSTRVKYCDNFPIH